MNYKKIFTFIFAMSFIALMSPFYVQAATNKSNVKTALIYYDSGGSEHYRIAITVADNLSLVVLDNTLMFDTGGGVRQYFNTTSRFATFDDALNYWNTHDSLGTVSYTVGSFDLSYGVVALRGSFNGNTQGFYPTLDDYLNPDYPWYVDMWNDFKDYLGATGEGIVDFFQNLIDSVFGEDSTGGPISHAVTIRNPTLAPTPTPIPYSTVVIPKTDIITGDTVYETNYYYVNPSGTPIVTSSPPTNTPSSGGGGGGSTEYVPVGGDPFSIPAVNWLTSATIGDNNYDGIDSINEGMGSVDSIGSEYTAGMNAVQESTGTLPTSWLLLIGIAAAIPLLAGIVSRFLGG